MFYDSRVGQLSSWEVSILLDDSLKETESANPQPHCWDCVISSAAGVASLSCRSR